MIEELFRLWKRASEDERHEFLSWARGQRPKGTAPREVARHRQFGAGYRIRRFSDAEEVTK